jgi:hypothetical protein
MPKVIKTNQGDRMAVLAGGEIDIESGGSLKLAGAEVSASAAELDEYVLTVDIPDLSADTSHFVVAPHAGSITKIWSVIDGAVSTADVTITPEIGGTPVTGGALTIATAGSAAGDVDSATPSAANAVTAGQAIELVVAGGGSGGSPRGHVSIVISR